MGWASNDGKDLINDRDVVLFSLNRHSTNERYFEKWCLSERFIDFNLLENKTVTRVIFVLFSRRKRAMVVFTLCKLEISILLETMGFKTQGLFMYLQMWQTSCTHTHTKYNSKPILIQQTVHYDKQQRFGLKLHSIIH